MKKKNKYGLETGEDGFSYTQKLEPKLVTEYSDGKHTIYKSFLAMAEQLMPPKAKKKWYAVYKVLKSFKFDDVELEEGCIFRNQIFLPHQARTIYGCIIELSCDADLLQEAIAKNYLEFIGVEPEEEDDGE